MSAPFTAVTRTTPFTDPTIWRELLLALVERNMVNDPFQALPFVYSAGMTVDDAIEQAYTRFQGQLANAAFYAAILEAVAPLGITFNSNGQARADSTPGFNSFFGSPSFDNQIAYFGRNSTGVPEFGFYRFEQSGDAYAWNPYEPLNCLRYRRAQTDAHLQSLDALDRGELEHGDIIGPHTLVDLQRLLSVVKYIQYGTGGNLVATQGAPGSLTSLVSKTVRTYRRQGVIAPYTLELVDTIGPSSQPLESLYDGAGGFAADTVVIEYHWTNFGT